MWLFNFFLGKIVRAGVKKQEDIFIKTGAIQTNIMKVLGTEYYPLRYSLNLSVTNTKTKALTLYVWAGQYGEAPKKNDAHYFYTELYNYEIPQ